MIDSTIIRAPRPSSWRKGWTYKKGLGLSRGGFTRKIHACSDGQGRPLAFELTDGEVSDYSSTDSLIDIPATTPCCFLSNKGYDRDKLREKRLFRGILPVIPPKRAYFLQFTALQRS